MAGYLTLSARDWKSLWGKPPIDFLHVLWTFQRVAAYCYGRACKRPPDHVFKRISYYVKRN